MEKPKLIVIGGVPASGKTSLATKLAEETGLFYISRDRIKEAVFDAGGMRDRAWSREIGTITYPIFQKLVEMYLERGDSVIAESTFTWVEDKDWLHETSKRYQADLYQIWLSINPLVAHQRFIERAKSERHCGHCDPVEEVINEFTRYFNKTYVPLPINGKTLVIDTTNEFPDFKIVLNFIN